MLCINTGFPGDTSGKEPTCQYRRQKRRRLHPWVRKRRAWQPTPAFLPQEAHGQRNLAGYSPPGLKEPDTTAVTWHAGTRSYRSLLNKTPQVLFWLSTSCWMTTDNKVIVPNTHMHTHVGRCAVMTSCIPYFIKSLLSGYDEPNTVQMLCWQLKIEKR